MRRRPATKSLSPVRLDNTTLILSPSDLTAHLACPRLTMLNRAVQLGAHPKPRPKDDPHLDLIRQRGLDHEAGYLDQLKAAHGNSHIVEIEHPQGSLDKLAEAAARTEEAMRAGVQVIFQAAFCHDGWQGFADFLLRVERPSTLGDYSYEVTDTKLARTLKVEYVHQLAQYSLHVTRIQGTAPERAHVVLGDGTQASFRLDDVLALHRRAVRRLEAAVGGDGPVPEPERVSHCSLCSFEPECTAILRDRDDLTFVATLGRDQRRKLHDLGTYTLEALSRLPADAEHGALSETAFQRLRVQAELQRLTRDSGELQHRHLPAERARGYAILPEPSPGDIFFDIEGDPFAGERGLIYLWGWEELGAGGEPEYRILWAHDEGEEKAAFERFVDLVVARRAAFPDMHVYHYGSPEIAIPRRLADQYGTRIAEIDRLLRGEVFCDLYTVVRQGIQVGQESYSIKQLEPFYGFERTSEVRAGGGSIIAYERWIEAGEQEILDDLARYNHEDCSSTRRLRDWLLAMRDEAAAEQGVDFAALRFPEPEEERPDPDWLAEVLAVQEQLEAGLPDDPAGDDADDAERRLLANLLFYYRREEKVPWWRYFELCDMNAEQLEGERDAIAGLELDPGRPPVTIKQSTGYWMTFPPQEHKLGLGDVYDPVTRRRTGTIVALEDERLLLKRGDSLADAPLPAAVIAGTPLDATQQRKAIVRVAQALLDGERDRYPAVHALLRRALPVVDGCEPGEPLVDGDVTVEEAQRVALGLRDSCLAVQGPPGAGKTYTGARMIAAALADGLRVGVSATNHKAIHNLIAEVERVARAEGVALNGMHKSSDNSHGSDYESELGLIASSTDNKDLDDDSLNLVSGTPWLFARPEHDGRFDLLFVDEAGQMSLADAVAIGTAARSVVLLGDQQQLPQVAQGTHPEGADASVLQHVVSGHDRIPAEQGLFLGITWRMHPGICEFISERFYERGLHSAPGCETQEVIAGGALHGAGLRMLEVEHEDRSQSSPEEAAAIARVCEELLDGGRCVLREDGGRALTAADIMVVAPYNLAVMEIARAVPEGVRVGTVDRFQGQEAPVVFYAMTCSSAEDAPRGLDFLFSPNRLNVAISRAQCLAVLVCSPRLLDAECRTLEQMRMVNHVCRYGEMASTIGGE